MERKRKASPVSIIRKPPQNIVPAKRRRRNHIDRAVFFRLSDDVVSRFRRMVKKPKDCVINALELMGILPPVSADLMRIVIGDVGLYENQILDIFRYLQPALWRLIDCTMSEIKAFCEDKLPEGNAVFCGFRHDTDHVFLIGKTLDSKIVILDPQLNMICHYLDPQCNRYFSYKRKYVILALDETTNSNTL